MGRTLLGSGLLLLTLAHISLASFSNNLVQRDSDMSHNNVFARDQAADPPVDISASVDLTVAAAQGGPKSGGGKCSKLIPAGKPGNAKSPWWMESIKHQGKSPFNPDPENYKVFRNVKDFGAKGDGIADDTVAINLAISSQGTCGWGNCSSSTLTPHIVYFPSGTYRVTSPIKIHYYSQVIGDAKNLPVLLADPTFTGLAVLDANTYMDGGAQYFFNTNNFHRSIRNFIVDLRQVPADKPDGTGIHWQVAQATSLMNIVVHMSTDPNTVHRGLFSENGSGGYWGDLIFNGGQFGIWGGNQQFTVRNITINNAQTAIFSSWNWGWTYQGVNINNCGVGYDILSGGRTGGGQTTGAQAIVDGVIKNTPIFIRNSQDTNDSLAGSLALNNIKLTNVPIAVGILDGPTVLEGTSRSFPNKLIENWLQGNIYEGKSGRGKFVRAHVPAPRKPASLLDAQGRVVGRMHPQYEDRDISDFVSARDHGAVGDGVTDDTKALQELLDRAADCNKIVFLDAGFYILKSTLTIPANTRLVGEAWSVLAGSGPLFQDQKKPRPVVKVGKKGDRGVAEISDIVFTTSGAAAGAIVVEWNIKEPKGFKAGAGMWDSHIRLAGTRGTKLEGDTCVKFNTGDYSNCLAAFLSLHITEDATGYFEGTWVWLSDHDLDLHGEGQISVYSGRGVLSESEGPVWMIGTGSEHHVIYQYNLVEAKDHWMGLIQTESPYYQPTPNSPIPFKVDERYHDPKPYSPNPSSAWALNVKDSEDIFIFGAGLYSFFDSYTQACIEARNCQSQIVNVDSDSDISIWSLSTVATTWQVSVNGKGVIAEKDNTNGFASTVTYWKR